jgi:predicted RNA-binding protein with PUA-like domain
MAKQRWLMKTEPGTYSIDDLERDGWTCWEGVRNYQARNLMRSMKVGDPVFIYHSVAKPPGVAGVARVSRLAYPDHFQFDPENDYYDPKSDPENPRWSMVDVEFVCKFDELLPLPEMREMPELEGLALLRRGQRLSVQPVSAEHWKVICRRAGVSARVA